MVENELAIGGQNIPEIEEEWRTIPDDEREGKWPIRNRNIELHLEFGDQVEWFARNG